ncbi:glycosyltransferase [Sulfurisoma sediminicola]|uniref:glycosyltransferase n=1 Tax=Sulfurisoma sediminicola TaxID=1381557 RepID=UPI0011C40E74|nr:glycosyltransferase [Sulfurisoma sediminicola]
MLAELGHEVVGIGERESLEKFILPSKVRLHAYRATSLPESRPFALTARFDEAVRRGLVVARTANRIKVAGFTPDVVLAHTGWGEAMFIKEVFPDAHLVGYFEYYFQPRATDIGFDPETPSRLVDNFLVRTANAINLTSLTACDAGIAPTQWQKSHYPAEFHAKLQVIHEGIDTETVRPDPAARFRLPGGRILTRADRVVTYVSRCLEPYRGFHVFMRSLPRLLELQPDAQVLIAGAECNRYSPPPSQFASYKDALLAELGDKIDPTRVHFLGKLAYPDYLKLLQVSPAHVYLTYPFVLSWSMLEAMAAGCVVVGSATGPVTEFIEDGRNGFLVDFFDTEAIANRIASVLDAESGLDSLRDAARATVVEQLDTRSRALPELLNLLGRLTT